MFLLFNFDKRDMGTLTVADFIVCVPW